MSAYPVGALANIRVTYNTPLNQLLQVVTTSQYEWVLVMDTLVSVSVSLSGKKRSPPQPLVG